uniref:Uncharacterized protein n=1 Tax=Anguilla anguilla TaxID=7936 RepID=A0A0E9VTJ7_ANGAN
MRSILPNYKIY